MIWCFTELSKREFSSIEKKGIFTLEKMFLWCYLIFSSCKWSIYQNSLLKWTPVTIEYFEYIKVGKYLLEDIPMITYQNLVDSNLAQKIIQSVKVWCNPLCPQGNKYLLLVKWNEMQYTFCNLSRKCIF